MELTPDQYIVSLLFKAGIDLPGTWNNPHFVMSEDEFYEYKRMMKELKDRMFETSIFGEPLIPEDEYRKIRSLRFFHCYKEVEDLCRGWGVDHSLDENVWKAQDAVMKYYKLRKIIYQEFLHPDYPNYVPDDVIGRRVAKDFCSKMIRISNVRSQEVIDFYNLEMREIEEPENSFLNPIMID